MNPRQLLPSELLWVIISLLAFYFIGVWAGIAYIKTKYRKLINPKK